MPPPPPPPLPPPQHHYKLTTTTAATAFPDLFLTALSLLFLFSSSSSSSSSSSTSFLKTQFLKIPFLSLSTFHPRRSLSMSSSTDNRTHRFPTPQSLSEWLKPRLPSDSLSSWGVKPGTKNVHNLWLELAHGETSLDDSSPPLRTVHVVSIRIFGPSDTILIESRQELSDGSVRTRWRPLSEKMKPDEAPEEAVFRAVKEELGCDSGKVRIVPGSYKNKVEERDSVSYPGLPAKYMLHSVDVTVEGLSEEEEFVTEEAEEYEDSEETRAADGAVSVKKHFWKWVSPDSIES